ncbi:MAG: TonB-dependent receptor [Bacteroidota bacterium]
MLLLGYLSFLPVSLMSQPTTTLIGKVLDDATNYPLIGANIVVENNTNLAAVSDANGDFRIANIPVGRINIQVSYIGYETVTMENVWAMAGKTLQMEIPLAESLTNLTEIVVRSSDKSSVSVNELVTNSVNQLQVEEVVQYAGTLGDVARMAQNYAGVSGATDDRNDVIVRGNAPFTVLWRVEGVDIPSPNHWATLGTTGGPISLLNTNNLRTSDFLTGAFPSEYGNAVGAVFDLKLRNGNPCQYEFLGQIGFNGFEVGAEGPIKGIGKNASFVANYRYSTLGLVNKLGLDFGTGFAVPQYQDLNFKINIPTAKKGTFSLWGLSGKSDIFFEAEPDAQNFYSSGDENLRSGTNSTIIGLNHLYFFNEQLSSSVALLGSYTNNQTDIAEFQAATNGERLFFPTFISTNQQQKYSLNWTLNYKVNAKHRLKVGVVHEQYVVDVRDSIFTDDNNWFAELDYQGNTSLSRLFAHWNVKLSEQLTMDLGWNTQYFGLNQSFSFEPRWGMKYQLTPTTQFNLAYGYHSQMQPLPIYFSKDYEATPAENSANGQLDFMKSHHFVLGYQQQFGKGYLLKLEAYYQLLNGVASDPTDRDFSILNFGADFGFPNRVGLRNIGTGNNYGLELTLKKQLDRGFYFLLTGSLFESTYDGAQNQIRNTYYNGNYVTNCLVGKEFSLGRHLLLQLNGRFTYAGSRRFTPIDLERSIAEGEEVRFDDQPFSASLAPYLRPDLKIGLVYNTPKQNTHSFSIDFQNFIGRENELFKEYDEAEQRILTTIQRGFFPDVRYQVLF